MVRSIGKMALAAVVGAATAVQSVAMAQSCPEDAMIVFDGSGSMSEMGFNRLNEPRIFEARQAMRQALPRIAPFRRLGLVVYGPGGDGGCSNVDLRFGPRPNAANAVISAVETLEPDGDTALTEAVARAAAVLGAREGIILLVTDGDETCGGQPCELASQLADAHVGLTVHVVGFRVRDAHFNWQEQADDAYVSRDSKARCLADRTGGSYFAAESVDDLVRAMRQSLGCQVIGQRHTAPHSPNG